MNLDFKKLLPDDFDGDSRVWIYQSSRLFSPGEALELEDTLQDFAKDWLSHGSAVKGFATLLFGQFVVLMADETEAGVSGCSTDGSVRLIKELADRYRVNLLDRLLLAFVIKDRVQLLPMAQLDHAFANGFIDGDTLYFNNTVQTKSKMETDWIVPVKQSWLAKKMPTSRQPSGEQV